MKFEIFFLVLSAAAVTASKHGESNGHQQSLKGPHDKGQGRGSYGQQGGKAGKGSGSKPMNSLGSKPGNRYGNYKKAEDCTSSAVEPVVTPQVYAPPVQSAVEPVVSPPVYGEPVHSSVEPVATQPPAYAPPPAQSSVEPMATSAPVPTDVPTSTPCTSDATSNAEPTAAEEIPIDPSPSAGAAPGETSKPQYSTSSSLKIGATLFSLAILAF